MRVASGDQESIVYIDGEYLPENQAKISVFDHVVLYGDGVYDTCCAWGGKVFKLDAHLDRLFESARAVKLDVPVEKSTLRRVVLETVKRNHLEEAYVKIIVTRGVGKLPLLSPYHCVPTVIVFAKPYMRLADGDDEKSIRVKIASLRRIPDESLYAKVKSSNYQNHVLARMEANEAGYDDAIELTIGGYVAEAPGYNVFVIKHGALLTPRDNILVGITRQTVLELASRHGIVSHECALTPFDLFNADEIFFSSTAGGIFPVGEVDGRRIGDGAPGPVTRRVRSLYHELLESGEASIPVY
ncbi:MAG TPA: branched-chain-amino-acid transaminase [bacterium]|nr:branched-chain-amino-acid transaminase [bacterium]